MSRRACAQYQGRVFVNNTGTTQVLEISRTGSIVNTFTDSVGYPVGCAIDPATGNLAVANIFGFYGAGQVRLAGCEPVLDSDDD